MLSTLYSRIKKALSRSKTVSEGDKLPGFKIQNQDGEPVSSSDIQDAIIYFYPKANTPGCTKEACSFRDSISDLNNAGLEVYGVSTDTVETQKRFHDSEELNFDLLADRKGDLADKFGVLSSTGFAKRTTFIVREGEIEKVFREVNPEDHVQQVLKFLDQ